MTSDVTVLLTGGRSGVGKTSVAAEASELPQEAGVAHCLIDGDDHSAAYPKAADDPHGSALAEVHLRALRAGCTAIGHTRAIYVNTVSVLEAAMVLRAMGGGTATAVLLTADDDTAAARLGQREIGSALASHVDRSTAMAEHLQRRATADVIRAATDDRGVRDIALEALHVVGWWRAPDEAVTARGLAAAVSHPPSSSPGRLARMLEVGARARTQPAPPRVLFEALEEPHRDPSRPWLELLDDEVEPVVVEASGPHLLVWSSLWTARPDARVRFEVTVAGAGSRLRWVLLVDEPSPEAPLLGHLRKRLDRLVNANLRYSFGQ